MVQAKPPKSASAAASFPFSAIWEDYPEGVPAFADLEPNESIYETLNSADFGQVTGIARYDPDKLAELVAGLALQPERSILLHKRLKLVAGFYLAPERQRVLGTDRFSSIKLLGEIAMAADALASLLDRLAPSIAAAIYLTPSGEPEFDEPGAPMPHQISALARALAAVCAGMAEGAAPQRPGPRGMFVRDTMLYLTMKALLEAGLGLPGASDGTTSHSGKHLSGTAGEFMRDFVKLIAPKLREASLVPVVRRVRPRVGKT